jgi:hypothetical protein
MPGEAAGVRSSLTAGSGRCVASNSPSGVPGFAFLRRCFIFENASSMGLRSGE